jgi:predicted RNase H-like HicB family nuclease
MGDICIRAGNGRKSRKRSYDFTVVVLPVYQTDKALSTRRPRSRAKKLRRNNPMGSPVGYKLTVPVLPGLITFGRTPKEAREMAQDAIRVHVEGLRKSGEPIPDERTAQIEQIRIPVPA